MTTSPTHLCEATVTAGLESVAADEIERRLGNHVTFHPPGITGSIRFDYQGGLKALLKLQTVLAVYLVRTFAVPRPKALLGDQHWRALLGDIKVVRGLHPLDAFHTLYISAAGAESAVMIRLKDTLASETGLKGEADNGDLQIRVRRGPAERVGWEALIRLSPRPLTARPWHVCHRKGALDPSVAHAMALLTMHSPADTFVNLCCGSGTLLIERLACGPAQRVIGCDIDPEALACAQANVEAANRSGEIELMNWDAGAVPLPPGSVDALCADLPFGTQIGSHGGNLALYPAILKEAGRLAKTGARFCVLTGEVRLMDDLLDQSKDWKVEQALRIRLAGLVPALFVLRRVLDPMPVGRF